MRKRDAILIVTMAFVLAAPSDALAYKKKALSQSIQVSHVQHSSRPTAHPVAFTVTTVGKSGGYK